MFIAKMLERAEARLTSMETRKLARLQAKVEETEARIADFPAAQVQATEAKIDAVTQAEAEGLTPNPTWSDTDRKIVRAMSRRRRATERLAKAREARARKTARRIARFAAIRHYFRSAFGGRTDGRPTTPPPNPVESAGRRSLGRLQRFAARIITYPSHATRRMWAWAKDGRTPMRRTLRRIAVALPIVLVNIAVPLAAIIPTLAVALFGANTALVVLAAATTALAMAFLVAYALRFGSLRFLRNARSRTARAIDGTLQVLFDSALLAWSVALAVLMLPFMAPVMLAEKAVARLRIRQAVRRSTEVLDSQTWDSEPVEADQEAQTDLAEVLEGQLVPAQHPEEFLTRKERSAAARTARSQVGQSFPVPVLDADGNTIGTSMREASYDELYLGACERARYDKHKLRVAAYPDCECGACWNLRNAAA